jgi:hypothetical protein
VLRSDGLTKVREAQAVNGASLLESMSSPTRTRRSSPRLVGGLHCSERRVINFRTDPSSSKNRGHSPEPDPWRRLAGACGKKYLLLFFLLTRDPTVVLEHRFLFFGPVRAHVICEADLLDKSSPFCLPFGSGDLLGLSCIWFGLINEFVRSRLDQFLWTRGADLCPEDKCISS